MDNVFSNQEDIIVFIKSVLLKIENVESLVRHDPPAHIPAYQKILGIMQKFDKLNQEEQQHFFPYIVMTRGVLTLFMNGRYEQGMKQVSSIKDHLIRIVKTIEKNNERD